MKQVTAKLLATLMAASLSSCTLHQIDGPPVNRGSQLNTEQQWIVQAIGTDVADLLLFSAKDKKLDLAQISVSANDQGEQRYAYLVKCGELNFNSSTQLKKFVWLPENYTELANALATKLGQSFDTKAAYNTQKLVSETASFNTDKLAKANKEISESLTASPLNADLNEAAAFLCGIFAIRETASCFTDTRPWLNQMAAHLAIASAARKGAKASAAGQVSRIILLERCGRQSDALKLLEQFAKETKADAAIQSLLRGLKIRITNDYRLVDMPHASNFEKLAYANALTVDINADALTEFLQKDKSGNEVPIDYIRLGMRGRTSVGSGHIYCTSGISAELGDAAEEMYLFEGIKTTSVDQLINAINATAAGALENDNGKWILSPISRTDLAAFHSRQLLDACFQTHHFLYGMWGVKDQAAEMLESTKKQFAKLTLFPLYEADVLLEKRQSFNPDLDKALVDLSWNHPELITFKLWNVSSKNHAEEPMRAIEWFGNGLPFGTAYDFDNRQDQVNRMYKVGVDELAAMAPYDAELIGWYAGKKFNLKPTGPQLKSLYKGLADYSLTTMRDLASVYRDSDKKEYVAQLVKIAKIVPETNFRLAEYYETEDSNKAASFYEKGMQVARDPVSMSYYGGWLIDYYREKEEHDKAEALANKVGEVYSHVGLLTQGYYQERSGRVQEAESTFKKIKERYDSDVDLDYLYVRHADLNPVYKNKAEEVIKKIFPEGMKKYVAQSGPPTGGVSIQSISLKTAKIGMDKGDIVVAVQGIAIENDKQFALARQSIVDTNITYVFWHQKDKKYLTKSIKLHNYLLGCDVQTYGAKSKATEVTQR